MARSPTRADAEAGVVVQVGGDAGRNAGLAAGIDAGRAEREVIVAVRGIHEERVGAEVAVVVGSRVGE